MIQNFEDNTFYEMNNLVIIRKFVNFYTDFTLIIKERLEKNA